MRANDLFPPSVITPALIASVRRGRFIDYVLDFYGPGGIYPMGATRKMVDVAICGVEHRFGRLVYDSVDRERVRDELIKVFGLVFPLA
jgi:hypothetical protein